MTERQPKDEHMYSLYSQYNYIYIPLIEGAPLACFLEHSSLLVSAWLKFSDVKIFVVKM